MVWGRLVSFTSTVLENCVRMMAKYILFTTMLSAD